MASLSLERIFRRVVLFLAGVALILAMVAVVDFILHPLEGDYNFNSVPYRAVTVLVLIPLNLIAGFIIMRRVPGNVVGPLLLVWSGTVSYNSMRVGIGTVPFAIYYCYDLTFGWLALFLMILHFPDGKIFPPRPGIWIYRQLGLNFIFSILISMSTNPLQVPDRIQNPFYIPAVAVYADLILNLSLLFIFSIVVLDVVSPVMRYRKGSPLERQQIKWLTLFAGSIAIYTAVGLIAYPLLTGGQVMNPGTNSVAVVFYLLAELFPPVAIGIAVLRYRLWEIDRILRLTLVYTILTVILTVVYLATVLMLRNLFAFLFQLESSEFATVVSTLAIASMFTPLRNTIQRNIDRRFFREKYDAEKILTAFSDNLVNETNIDHLQVSIIEVIKETMNPEIASLWLRKTKQQPGDLRTQDIYPKGKAS